jgi:hypothetical protein
LGFQFVAQLAHGAQVHALERPGRLGRIGQRGIDLGDAGLELGHVLFCLADLLAQFAAGLPAACVAALSAAGLALAVAPLAGVSALGWFRPSTKSI